MNIITVYRVEHKEDGIGPYRHNKGSDFYHQINRDHGDENHPADWEDGFFEKEINHPLSNRHHKFGFLSMGDVKEWFDGYLPSLRKHGFVVKKYTTPRKNVIVGNSGKQVIFWP